MHRLTNDEYYAGLWHKDLIKGLLWWNRSGGKSLPLVKYRAPSWSWASKDIPVATFEAGQMPADIIDQVDIETAVTQPAGHDKFGEVTSGSLIVIGYIQRWEIRNTGGEVDWSELLLNYKGIRVGTLRLDKNITRSTKETSDFARHDLLHFYDTSRHPWKLRPEKVSAAMEKPFDPDAGIEVLRILLGRIGDTGHFYHRFYGLAVQPVQGMVDTYRRYGFVRATESISQDGSKGVLDMAWDSDVPKRRITLI